MTTITEVFEAVVDAVIADPTINQGGARDAALTVATIGVSDSAAAAWLDELATLYQSIGIINNNTWAAFRNEINNKGKPVAMALFDALVGAVNGLASSGAINVSVQKVTLRAERDEADANIDRLIVIRAGESARQVKEAINLGIQQLRAYKQQVIQELRSVGDV